ncbi:hypothetical protein C8R45DRAFT_816813, partial [Mycena sanguinolenta]
GLETWVPDALGPPDSLYNLAHETVYFESFRQVATSFAYIFLAPTMSGVDNPDFVRDVMRSFPFSYMRNKAKIERNEPGKLADGTHVYFVNKKSIRSASANAFIQKLDARRAKSEGGGRRRGSNLAERKRIRRDQPSDSDFSLQRPTKVPVDYFAPDEFNDLPVKARFNYAKNGIALPLVQFLDNKDWKTMDKSSFMEKYGNQVLAQYSIPTQEEMDRAGNTGWDSEEEINLQPEGPNSDDPMNGQAGSSSE